MLNDNASGIYNNAEQSFVCCFKPDFATGDNVFGMLFDSSNGSRYLAEKRDNANNNQLNILLANTVIATIAEATYKPYWKIHGLNVLVVAGTTGNTDVWLNGFKILNADNTAWSPANPLSIYIGSTYQPGEYFDGEIFHFSCYAFKMTPIQMQTITNDLMREYSG